MILSLAFAFAVIAALASAALALHPERDAELAVDDELVLRADTRSNQNR